jgi:DNA invertase Pin-like site-specific DNA recombinase
VTICQWFVEEVTGGAPLDRRPILLEAIASVAEHGAGYLVVQRLDRFSRDPLSAALAEAELQRHRATVAVAIGAGGGEDPTAQLVRSVLIAVGKFEKALIAARIKAALSVKKARNEMTGAAPYGMRVGNDGKTLEADPGESATRERLRTMRAGGLTLREIREQGAREGLVNRKGNPFGLAALHAMVKDANAYAT